MKPRRAQIQQAQKWVFPLLLLLLSIAGIYLVWQSHLKRQQELTFLQQVQKAHYGAVQDALKQHPEYVHLRDEAGQTPLHLASQIHDRPMFELILEHNPEIDAQVDGHILDYIAVHDSSDHGHLNTALHNAVLWADVPMIEKLLKRRAALNLPNAQNWTPLHLSLFSNRDDITLLLLEYGADVNAPGLFGQRPLHIAIERGDVARVELLLQHAAKPHLADDHAVTALQKARDKDTAASTATTRKILALLQAKR
ncbi:MAG: ankyrin repeat domain-containing protein [Candidatus Sericytochromatia bacterium]